MASREELLAALRNADAAGDAAAAQAIARALAGGQGGSPAQPPKAAPLAPIVPANPSTPFARAGGYSAASQGINDAVIKTGLGLKSLVTNLSEDDRMALKGMRQEKEEDPEGFKRGLGEFGGNVLIGAIPGSKIAGAASKAVKVGSKLAPYFGTAMGAAGTEFAQHPAEGDGVGERMEQKLTSAGKAAITAPLVQLGLRGMGKAITQPFKPTAEAEKLMAQGVNPTLQQGAGSAPGRFVGGLTSGALDTKARLRDEVANAWLGRVTKGKEAYSEGTAEDFLAAAKATLGDEYSKFWKGHTVNLSPTAVKALAEKAGIVLSNNRQMRDAMEARGIVADLVGDGSVNLRMKYDTLAEEVRNPLSTKMREATSEGVRTRLSDTRELLDKLVTRKGRTVGAVEDLKDIDRRMFDLKRGEEAVTPGALASEGMDISALVRAYAKNLPQAAKVGNTTFDDLIAPAGRLMSTTPVQHRSRALLQAGARTAGLAGAGTLAAGAGPMAIPLAALTGISLAGQTGRGARFLMGGTAAQKKMAKILQDLGPAAQALYTGTATTNSEGEE